MGKNHYHPLSQTKRKERKRTEAAERQAAYDALSLEEKRARIATRRGNSTKELARLAAKH